MLEMFWFAIIIASIASYAMLDGFDLGVGILHPLVKQDRERRIFLNAIGPIWDGNEVWLVVLVGALFAGFPYAYAALLSAFYTPLLILIFGLIFRAVAIEFRSRKESPVWRRTWDWLFFLGSLSITLLIGTALGNLIRGIPLNEHHTLVAGTPLSDFLHPYALLIGLLVLSLFVMHGTIYLAMKTEDELQKKVVSWINPSIIAFVMLYATATSATLIYEPHMADCFRERPYLFVLAALSMLAIANIPREVHHGRMGRAFLSSSANIALLLVLFALGLYPELVHSSVSPDTNSITIYNAAASHKTLSVLAVIVAIGLPLVIAYGFYIHHIFSGKVELDHMSY